MDYNTDCVTFIFNGVGNTVRCCEAKLDYRYTGRSQSLAVLSSCHAAMTGKSFTCAPVH